MRNPRRLPDGMSARTAACGIVTTLALSGMMLSSGAQLAVRNDTIDVVMAGLGAFLMGIALFSAWNTGRSSRNDGD